MAALLVSLLLMSSVDVALSRSATARYVSSRSSEAQAKLPYRRSSSLTEKAVANWDRYEVESWLKNAKISDKGVNYVLNEQKISDGEELLYLRDADDVREEILTGFDKNTDLQKFETKFSELMEEIASNDDDDDDDRIDDEEYYPDDDDETDDDDDDDDDDDEDDEVLESEDDIFENSYKRKPQRKVIFEEADDLYDDDNEDEVDEKVVKESKESRGKYNFQAMRSSDDEDDDGDEDEEFLIHRKASIDDVSFGTKPNRWTLMFEHDAEGDAIYGSVQDLINAISNGAEVRVGMRGTSSHSYFNADYVWIGDDGNVYAQNKDYVAIKSLSVGDGDRNFQFYRDDAYQNYQIINTIGQRHVVRYFFNGDYKNDGKSRYGAKWFVKY